MTARMQWLREKATTIGTPTKGWEWGKVALVVLAVLLVLASGVARSTSGLDIRGRSELL